MRALFRATSTKIAAPFVRADSIFPGGATKLNYAGRQQRHWEHRRRCKQSILVGLSSLSLCLCLSPF